MTVTTAAAPAPDVVPDDEPRILDPGLARTDRVFHNVARAIGVFVLVLTGSIGLFLGYQAIPTLRRYGLSFFTESQWEPERDVIGISSVLLGTLEVALVALVVAFPLALALALYISEYAPPKLKSTCVSLVDLMAAVPSIVYGLWGFFLLQPNVIFLSRWLSQHLGFLPIFKVDTDPNAAVWAQPVMAKIRPSGRINRDFRNSDMSLNTSRASSGCFPSSRILQRLRIRLLLQAFHTQ